MFVVILSGILSALQTQATYNTVNINTKDLEPTLITVENLFYNTPVRYKFLKKDFTEAGYIEDIVARLALSHPEISVKFIN